MTYFRRLKNSLIKSGNPGNNILDEITALDDIFSQLVFQGAMTSILGPNYINAFASTLSLQYTK